MELIQLAKHLIDLESITGNEKNVVDFLDNYLTQMGLKVVSQEIEPGRRNLFASTEKPAEVVLCTHTDTVPPFIPASEDNNFIYGRGACDTKSIIAAMLKAGEKLLTDKVEGFGYLFVIGEETNSIGAKRSNEIDNQARFMVVGEPTENKLGKGHKGIFSFKLTANGRAVHSGFPELGDSAIDKLLPVLQKLQQTDFGFDRDLGDCTINIGKLTGGQAHNIVPDLVVADISVRAAVPLEQIRSKVKNCLSNEIELTVLTESEPQKLYTLPGFETIVLPFGTDIPHLKNWGKALLCGPGDCRVAHTDSEKISKKELKTAIDFYQALVKKLL